MTHPGGSPPFGQADLTNCERELIHIPGSIQPHGVLLVVREEDGQVLRCSANAEELLGVDPKRLLGASVGDVLQGVETAMADLGDIPVGSMPVPRRVRTPEGHRLLAFLHRPADGITVVELEDLECREATDHPRLPRALPDLLESLSTVPSVRALADTLTRGFRRLTGYDRVMVYRFDADGHGEILSEAKRDDLETFLGLHYPASDIPERARELYMRNRVRLLVDVAHEPAPLVPEQADEEEPLDMSQCVLRAMSPMHLQYLENMGVTATLVASILYQGRLWGLIACHHYEPKYLAYDLRATADVLAETMSTRIAVLESYRRAEAEVQVRHLEEALAEAVTSTGEWRSALFGKPSRILRPVGAQGAALVHNEEVVRVGDTPHRSDVLRLTEWLQEEVSEEFFHTSALGETAPTLKDLTPNAAGVMAFRLSRWRGEYLLWFRRERQENVRWAGDPRAAKEQLGDDPTQLSPRRSFAVWTEQVRGTSAAWGEESLVAGEAIGLSLRDINGQTRAMRFLLAQRQLTQARENVLYSEIPVVLADSAARILLVSQAFSDLFRPLSARVERLTDLAELFEETEEMRARLPGPRTRSGWRGTATLRTGSDPMPVAIRIDPIPLPGNQILGFVLMVTDLTPQVELAESRMSIRNAIGDMRRRVSDHELPTYERLLGSILAQASLAAAEIGEPFTLPPQSDQPLREVEASVRRAARISRLIVDFTPDTGGSSRRSGSEEDAPDEAPAGE